MFLIVWTFFLFVSTFAHMMVAALPVMANLNADSVIMLTDHLPRTLRRLATLAIYCSVCR